MVLFVYNNKSYFIVSTIDANFGGSEWLWYKTAILLKSLGCDVTVYLSFYKSNIHLNKLLSLGIKLEYGTPPPRRIWRRFTDFIESKHFNLAAAIERVQPDITLISMGNHIESSFFSSQFNALPEPYILLPQLVMPIYVSSDSFIYHRSIFENAEKVCFVSLENRHQCEVDLGLDLSATSVIVGNAFVEYDIVNTAAPPPWKVAVPARLDFYQKGQDILLRALVELRGCLNDLEVHFYCDDPLRRILRFATLHRLTNVFVHPHQAMEKVLTDNHAVLLPSRFEGMSLSMLEAMFAGLPVFATPVAGVSEVIVDGVNGFVAESISVYGVQKLLLRAYESRFSWAAMGQAGANILRSKSIRKAEDKLAEILFKTCSRQD